MSVSNINSHPARVSSLVVDNQTDVLGLLSKQALLVRAISDARAAHNELMNGLVSDLAVVSSQVVMKNEELLSLVQPYLNSIKE